MDTTLHRGPSYYNGEEIAVQAQCTHRPAKNDKTGDMVALAIWGTGGIPADKDAQRAACGGCALLESGVCYVVKMRLRASWDRIAATILSLADFRRIRRVTRRPIRIGSDGDPAAVPAAWWRTFFAEVRPHRRGWTGYTHGWKARPMITGEVAPACDPVMSRWFMASCDTAEERTAAKALGYRTARVSVDGILLPGEIECPAIKTKGRIQCDVCLLCNGLGDGESSASPYFGKLATEDHPDIVFPVHGGAGQAEKFANLVEALSE